MTTEVGLERKRKRTIRALRLGGVLGLSILLIEMALTLLRSFFRLGGWEALFDGGLLALLVSPILYLLLLRPLTEEIARREDIEQDLGRFTLGMERSGEAVFMTAIDGTIIYANPAFEELYGFKCDDWQGKTPRILKSGVTSHEVYEHLWASMGAKQLVTEELINKTKDGRLLTIHSSSNPILDEDGRLLGFLALQRDITEYRRAEEELRESEERHRAMFEANPHPMFVFDEETLEFVSVNDAAIAHYGYSRDEFLSMTIGDIRPVEDMPHLWEALAVAKKRPGVDLTEARHRKRDGTLMDVEITSHLLDVGGRPARFVLSYDITERKQAEEALRESELQLQAAQRLAAIGNWSWDIATDTVTWSEELYAIHGLDPELAAPSFAEQPAWYTPESWSGLTQAVERAVRTGQPYELELEIVRRDGEHRWTIAMGAAVRDEGGEIRGLYGTVQDMEEKKQAALRLQESEETWRTLVNANPESLFLVDTEGAVLVANEAAAARLGRSVQDLVGANAQDVLPEEAAAARQRVVEQVVRTGRPVRFQDRLHDRYIDYHVHPVLDGQGRVAKLAVLGVDLTEHREAEEALARAGAATQALLGIVSRLDAQLSLTDTLQALCEETLRAFSVDGVSICLYNKAANAFIDAASAGLPAEYHEQGQPISKALYEHYVGHMGPLIVVPDVQAVEGLPDQGLYSSLDIRNVVVASMVREGELIGILSLLCLHEVREFTPDELSLLEGLAAQAAQAVHGARLRDQVRQGQKMEAIGRFAGGVAHDFNNLLTAVVGYADLSRECLPPDSEAREYLTEIQKAADRATVLTRSLLAFSRRQIFAPHVLDLNEVANAITGFLERIIGEDIDLAFVRDPNLFPVEADPGQIEQVIMNLVINARDAIAGEGTITLETANVELDETYASTHPSVEPGPYVMLAVSDTGTGMDQATLAQVFEPFFTTKEVGQGTGLGLAVVYGIVKQNGGNIWVYSEPGSGSTFKVYLRRANKPLDWRPTLRETPEEPAGVGEETILLVEDDPAVRQLAANILEGRGYDVLQAASPEEGIALFDGHEGMVHLVLTDVVMPGMSGRAMVDQLLERRGSFFPVLYMSGYTRNAIVHEGRLDPDVDLLEKPFTPEALARKVREILDSPQRGQRELPF